MVYYQFSPAKYFSSAISGGIPDVRDLKKSAIIPVLKHWCDNGIEVLLEATSSTASSRFIGWVVEVSDDGVLFATGSDAGPMTQIFVSLADGEHECASFEPGEMKVCEELKPWLLKLPDGAELAETVVINLFGKSERPKLGTVIVMELLPLRV